jgi:hypothetical protein
MIQEPSGRKKGKNRWKKSRGMREREREREGGV